jgi:hypothetical protein
MFRKAQLRRGWPSPKRGAERDLPMVQTPGFSNSPAQAARQVLQEQPPAAWRASEKARMTFDAILERFQAKRVGANFMAKCPAHADRLTDCNYPVCPIHSSVMETGAPVASVNSLIGLPGPNSCDRGVVFAVAPDYNCPCPDPGTCPPNYLWNYNTCSCVRVSPIVLDISGKGFFLTDAQNGVLFDPGTGYPVQMAWTAKGADNAFLALPEPDGLVHTGKQLFGNFTVQPTSPEPNGFRALAIYDDPENGGNGDGIVDSRDAIFPRLRLWVDANHDGISQPEELHILPSLGVNSISLAGC